MTQKSSLARIVRTRSELLDAGYDPCRVSGALDRSEMTRLRWGAYAAASDVADLAFEDLHAVKIAAYDKAARGRHVYVRESAAVLHGLSLLSVPDRLTVGVPGAGGRSATGVITRSLPAGHLDRVVEIGGHEATCLLDTLVDCARFCDHRAAMVVVESALNREYRDGLKDPSDADGLYRTLRRALLSTSGRGSRKAKRVAEAMSPWSESVGETLSLILFREARLVAPRQQVELGRYRVDFLWKDQRVVVEFDGLGKYTDHAAWRAEKRRELWLQENGWTVVRISWEMVRDRPEAIVRRLRQLGVPLAA